MKIEIVRGGGVAGLASRTRLDSEALSADDTSALEGLVDRSSLLASPPRQASSPRYPDELLYSVTVGDGKDERTHSFSEGDLPEEVDALVKWVDAHPRSEEEITPL
jgi:hypothetical protein